MGPTVGMVHCSTVRFGTAHAENVLGGKSPVIWGMLSSAAKAAGRPCAKAPGKDVGGLLRYARPLTAEGRGATVQFAVSHSTDRLRLCRRSDGEALFQGPYHISLPHQHYQTRFPREQHRKKKQNPSPQGTEAQSSGPHRYRAWSGEGVGNPVFHTLTVNAGGKERSDSHV